MLLYVNFIILTNLKKNKNNSTFPVKNKYNELILKNSNSKSFFVLEQDGKNSKQKLTNYLENLPETLVKDNKNLDLFSIIWLQKIGRYDLLSSIEEDKNLILKYRKQKVFKISRKKNIEKKSCYNIYKKKLKISLALGIFKEEKIIYYSNLIKTINNKSLENYEPFIRPNNIVADIKKNVIIFSIIEVFNIEKNVRILICILFFILIKLLKSS